MKHDVPRWEEHPDGSRSRVVNGIRLVDRSGQRGRPDVPAVTEHLVTWTEERGHMVVLGLDAACRPVFVETLHSYR